MQKLNKLQSLELGNTDGQRDFETLALRGDLLTIITSGDDAAIRQESGLRASASAASAGISQKNVTYFDAYVRAFSQGVRTAHGKLPEVVAARRLQYLRWKLDGVLDGWDETLAKFKKGLDENALYALQWSDRIVKAAASRDVALRLQSVLEHATERGDNDPVRTVQLYALEQTVRGARSGAHSTSASSNLCEEATTAAYAEFAELMVQDMLIAHRDEHTAS